MTDESSFEQISMSSGELSESWDLVSEHSHDTQHVRKQTQNGVPICSICSSPVESIYFRCSTCEDLIICRNCESKPNRSVLCLGGASHLLALCNHSTDLCYNNNTPDTGSIYQSDGIPVISPENRVEQWIARSSRSASISSSSSSSHYNSAIGEAYTADTGAHQNAGNPTQTDELKHDTIVEGDQTPESPVQTQKNSPSLVETLQSMTPLVTIPNYLKSHQSANQLFQQDRLPHRINANTFLDDSSTASMNWFGFGSSFVGSITKRLGSDQDQTGQPTSTISSNVGTVSPSTASSSSLGDRGSPVGFCLSRDSSPQSRHSLSSSPLGVATEFLKSVVRYSAAAFNSFDLLPMDDPSEFRISRRSENRSNSISSTDSNCSTGSSHSPSPNLNETQRPLDTISSTFGLKRSPPPTRCFPSFNLSSLDSRTCPTSLIKTWDHDRFRDLVNPKPLPRTITECTAYNLR